MDLYKYKDLDESLVKLRRKGGSFSKAADRVWAILGRAHHVDSPLSSLKTTNHGESRIKHCVKYDLAGASRLITVQTGAFPILLFAGDHEDCDRWLDANRGRVFTVDGQQRIQTTRTDTSDAILVAAGDSPLRFSEPLLQRLPTPLADRLFEGIPFSVLTELNSLSPASSTEAIGLAAAGIADLEKRTAVIDVLALLLAGVLSEAIGRAELFLGEAHDLIQYSHLDVPAIVDSEFVKKVDPSHPQYLDVLKRFAESADYKSWMLYMHPDQDELVEQVFNGSAKLLGVSGSGKTCVLVRRAVNLAQRYPGKRILVLTLNAPLAGLVRRLIESCGSEDTLSQIEVFPFFELCREILIEFEPEMAKHYMQVTWKGDEHIDEIWLEYYQCRLNNDDARVLHPVHDYLISQGFRADRYLREEMDWVRSACSPHERTSYLNMQRKGRAVPLGVEHRSAVLEGLKAWEKKMGFVGGADVLGVANALILQVDRIEPCYRCILVDESQDFGNVELQIIRALAQAGPDDLFLCGDAAQQVSSRYQSLREAGIDIPGARSHKLQRNYRNSKDILLAANEVLARNVTAEMIEREDFEILDPVYSAFESTVPVLLRAENPEKELGQGLSYANNYLHENSGRKVCVAIAGHSLFEIERWSRQYGLLVLNGTTQLDEGSLFVSDLEQTKGFEFDLVCILNCSDKVFPRSGDPESEWFRDLSRLYVAMTRAKLELVLSYSCKPSPFLTGVDDYIARGEWNEYGEGMSSQVRELGRPQHISQFVEEGDDKSPLAGLTGSEFLYTEGAVGLTPELIARMRNLVDGRGLVRGRQRVRWKSIGAAAEDFRMHSHARREWGPVVGRQFSDLCVRLGL